MTHNSFRYAWTIFDCVSHYLRHSCYFLCSCDRESINARLLHQIFHDREFKCGLCRLEKSLCGEHKFFRHWVWSRKWVACILEQKIFHSTKTFKTKIAELRLFGRRKWPFLIWETFVQSREMTIIFFLYLTFLVFLLWIYITLYLTDFCLHIYESDRCIPNEKTVSIV